MASDDKVICVVEDVRRSIVKHGGLPIVILPNQDVEYETTRPKDVVELTEDVINDLKKVIDMCDGILIPGGYKWYQYDEIICNYVVEKNMPFIYKCRN